MKRSLFVKFICTILAVSLVTWSTGCSFSSVASDLYTAEGKALIVQTKDGFTYELDSWTTDQSGNIEGLGQCTAHGSSSLQSQAFSGTIPAQNVQSIRYYNTDDSMKTEAIIVISAIAFFSLLSTIVSNDGARLRALGTFN